MPEDVDIHECPFLMIEFQTPKYRCVPNRRAWDTLAKRKLEPREEFEEVRRVNPLGKCSRIASISEMPNEQPTTGLVTGQCDCWTSYQSHALVQRLRRAVLQDKPIKADIN